MLKRIENFAWTFETASFLVALRTEPEDTDPADSFQFEDDIAAVREGAVEWFRATVEVYGPEGEMLGADLLGCCAYATVREFYTAHRDPAPLNRNCSLMRAACGENVCIGHYFPDMVRAAITAARKTIAARLPAYSSVNV